MDKKILLTMMAAVLFSAPSFAGAVSAPQYWEKMERKVRECAVEKQQAKNFVKVLRPLLDSYYAASACVTYTPAFTFPVEGYNSESIGGRKGSGYISNKFDFYQADKPGGHPAHDIFIKDINRDCMDDITRKPVKVLSASVGVVVSVSTGWAKGDILKGGNYVWVYDPELKALFYYAHLGTVAVKTGAIVEPGMEIGTVGRTGLNAGKRKSPTHLHFMFVTYPKDGTIKPRNIYANLVSGVMPGKHAETASDEKKQSVLHKEDGRLYSGRK